MRVSVCSYYIPLPTNPYGVCEKLAGIPREALHNEADMSMLSILLHHRISEENRSGLAYRNSIHVGKKSSEGVVGLSTRL